MVEPASSASKKEYIRNQNSPTSKSTRNEEDYSILHVCYVSQ